MAKTAVQVQCPKCGLLYYLEAKIYRLFVKDGDQREKDLWLDLKCPNTNKHYSILQDREYAALPMEKKEAFFQLWKKGGITLGEAAEKVGISSEMAAQVIAKNMHEYHLLKEKVEE